MLLPPFAAFLSAGPLTSRDPPVQSPIRGLPVDALTPTAWLKRICAAEMAVATRAKGGRGVRAIAKSADGIAKGAPDF